MRAFDLNFARSAKIFDPNFMRTWRKPACPRDKIFSGERALRGDEILSGSGILSDRALNVGEILSGGILNGGKFWIDNKILKGCEILKGVGILNDRKILRGAKVLNRMSRGGTRREFCRRVLRELCVKASPLHLRHKFQSAMSEMGAGSPSAPLKFQISVAALLRLKFGGVPNAILRLKFQNAAAEFARSKFKGSSRAVQCRKIRAQGQGE